MHYIVREYIGYGKIDPIMRDHMIEDVSVDGVNSTIYVWHREYESLPTNILYNNAEELNSFTVRLAFLAGKQIWLASPLLDTSLPDGSRIQKSCGELLIRFRFQIIRLSSHTLR